MSIRWRLTLFNALIIGAILLALGLALFFLLREALVSGIEETARGRAFAAAAALEDGDDPLDEDDTEQLTADGVFLVVRDSEGRILNQTSNLSMEEVPRDHGMMMTIASVHPAVVK